MAKENIPKWDDTEEIIEAQPEEMGVLEAVRIGGGQGLTLGFADELAGMVESAADVVASPFMETPREQAKKLEKEGFTGDIGPRNLVEQYKQARDAARQELRKAEEERPYTTIAGEVAGGLLVPIPGASVAKGASMATKVSKSAPKLGAAGAVAGAGLSEGESIKDVLGDAVTGASYGVAGAAALPALGAGIKGGAKAAKGVAEYVMGPLEAAYKQSVKRPIMGRDAIRALQGEMTETGEKLAPEIKETFQDLARKKRNILEEAEQAGQKMDIDREISEASSSIDNLAAETFDPEVQGEIKRIKSILDGYSGKLNTRTAAPKDVEKLKKSVSKLSVMGDKSLKDPDLKGLATKTTQELNDILKKELPEGYSRTNEQISAMKRGLDVLGIKEHHKLDPRKLMDKFIKAVEGEATDSATAAKARQISSDFIDAVETGNPDLAGRFAEQIKDFGEASEVIKQMSRRGELMQLIRTGGTYAAAGAGAAKRNIGEFTREIGEQTPEWFNEIGTKMMSKGSSTASRYGNILRNLAGEQDTRRKQAIIFQLMQQPGFRQELKSVSLEPSFDETDTMGDEDAEQ